MYTKKSVLHTYTLHSKVQKLLVKLKVISVLGGKGGKSSWVRATDFLQVRDTSDFQSSLAQNIFTQLTHARGRWNRCKPIRGSVSDFLSDIVTMTCLERSVILSQTCDCQATPPEKRQMNLWHSQDIKSISPLNQTVFRA